MHVPQLFAFAGRWRVPQHWRRPEEDGVARHPLGFVTNGSFDELRGHAVALGFCAAGDLFSLPVETAGGAVLVAVRNASSRHFRLALASVCCERH